MEGMNQAMLNERGCNPNEMRALWPSDVVAGAGFEPATFGL
jgi:hypothetical protein